MADKDEKDDVGAKLAFLWAAWGWLAKKFGKSGTVEIIIPIHRGDPINHQPWVAVEGKSKDTKGRIFWLLTHDGDNYWPMRPISFSQDGRWTGRYRTSHTTSGRSGSRRGSRL